MKVAVVASDNSLVVISLYIPFLTTHIITGGGGGAELCARTHACLYGLPCTDIPPDYCKHRFHARSVQSERIAAEADLLLAFWDGKSKRVKQTIDKFKVTGKPVFLYQQNNRLQVDG